MLKISQAQVDSLGAISAREFEQSVATHLKALAPAHTGTMGEEALSEFILTARERALSFGITQKETTRVWLELSMLWGIDFPDDPQFSFAKAILEQEHGELLRMRRLHRQALEFIFLTNGETLNYHHDALHRVASQDLGDQLHREHADDSKIASYLDFLWPEKCDAAGSAAMVELVVACRANAVAHNLDVGAGPIILAVLSLFTGVGCLEDPQYPWIARSLVSPGLKGVEHLYRRSHAYLKAVLNHG